MGVIRSWKYALPTASYLNKPEIKPNGSSGGSIVAQIEMSVDSANVSRAVPRAPDLTSCDLEPITRLERIQSFGFLIAVTRDWVICRV